MSQFAQVATGRLQNLFSRRNRMTAAGLVVTFSRILNSKSKRISSEWDMELEDWLFDYFRSVPMADAKLEPIRLEIVATLSIREDDRLTNETILLIQKAVSMLKNAGVSN